MSFDLINEWINSVKLKCNKFRFMQTVYGAKFSCL